MVRAQKLFSIRPARRGEASKEGPLAQLFEANPDGFLLAVGADGSVRGRAACLVRDDVLIVAHLFVEEAARGSGIGTALLSAAKEHGHSRGTRTLEILAPTDPATIGFLLERGLGIRGTVLALGAAVSDITDAVSGETDGTTFAPISEGAGLSGWVANLDRETRGFARTPEWTWWLRTRSIEAWSLKRRGHPEGIAALGRADDVALLGPIEARLPEAAASALTFLVSRASKTLATRVLALVASEARLLLAAAFGAGLKVEGTHVLFGSKSRGDLSRYAGAGTVFF